MSFVIVTDSCANLPEDMIEQYNLSIIPLCFHVGDREMKSYEKGKKTDFKQFYDMMRKKEMITTSLVDPDRFASEFSAILEQGEDVLYIGFSSALSGTYQSSTIAADMCREKYPERTIITVDSLAASCGQGLLALYAAMLRDEGKSISEVAAWVEENKLRSCHWFTVDDLFFLNRGGRVSITSAVFGSILQIKPVMYVSDEGKLCVSSKARGRKQAIATLVSNMEKSVEDPQKQIVLIAHADCEEDAQHMAKLVREKMSVKDIVIHYLDPVIGVHAGPGTLALFFMGASRL